MAPDDDALALVHQGWEHLKAQRPLAAWACWQRAARLRPDDPAARQALEALANAADLPAAARASYRFQTPATADRRARWDQALRAGGLEDLAVAARAFAGLADEDPADDLARLNLALCQAWLGRNVEAVATLEDVVRLLAPSDPDRAAEAWTLAEVLRRGAGAERLADDLRYVWSAATEAPDSVLDGILRRWPNLRPVESPRDPLSGGPVLDRGEVYEWLDGPLDPAHPRRRRVLATVVRTPGRLRLSTPDPTGLALLDDPPYREVAGLLRDARREATPLPLSWSDAALGRFRFPAGLDEPSKRALAREAIEHEFEDHWIHQPRQALDGRSPLEASRGDAEARAKLAGVVRFREQLGSRPSHAALYLGYPFDRLRRRLGLIRADESGVVDADDLSCMTGAELDALDPAKLDRARLAEALASAAGLRDDARTARFATAWLDAGPTGFDGLEPDAVVAPLIRRALGRGDVAEALAVLDRAGALTEDPTTRRLFDTWAGEILARDGRPAEARARFDRAIAGLDRPAAALAALDAAETLLDNGHDEDARPLLARARDLAADAGMPGIVAGADGLLESLG